MDNTQKKHKVAHAYDKGYRIIDGQLYNPKNKILKGSIHAQGYRRTGIIMHGKYCEFYHHALCAYQKFGEIIFQKDIVVRHLDNDKLNNTESNIDIGTVKDNCRDMGKERLSQLSKQAHNTKKRLKDPLLLQEIFQTIELNTLSNQKIADKFGIDRKTVATLIKKYNQEKQINNP
jgi:predicted XRE-type DNA-binding protein